MPNLQGKVLFKKREDLKKKLSDHLSLIATGNGVRFSKAISVGNQADLKVVDFLEYLGEDPDTEVILSYLEGVSEGRKFHKITKTCSLTLKYSNLPLI